MVNFKAGDVVIYLDDTSSGGQVTLGVPKVVQSVSPCGKYLRVHRDDTGDIGGYYAKDFALAQEQDDPLPPAPESVLYIGFCGSPVNVRKLLVEGTEYNDIRLSIAGNGVTRDTRLDADSVLQLAHDLRRMAMLLKRKEKQ